MPHLVREMGVSGDDVNLGTGFLEFGVVVGSVFDFGRAIEGECGRHENQHRPFAFEAFVRNLNEFAVVECLGFEGLDFGVDE